jgi:hypothetical protein
MQAAHQHSAAVALAAEGRCRHRGVVVCPDGHQRTRSRLLPLALALPLSLTCTLALNSLPLSGSSSSSSRLALCRQLRFVQQEGVVEASDVGGEGAALHQGIWVVQQ